MKVAKREHGFTLVEMIGVLAVIAILASVAAPRIFDAIEDAKVSNFVQQVKTLETAVAKFNADTSRWPRMYPTSDASTAPHNHQLLINAVNAAGDAIANWRGPYLQKNLVNPFSATAYQALYNTSDGRWACDVDGDGTSDGQFLVYRADGITDKIAEKISGVLDSDAGTANWKTQGRVKRYNGTHTSILAVCLARV
ncbi:MAG: prepilin-type N-terminal cleavage/methylation domain-containing protein [Pseudomonadota bacterium]